MADTRSETAKKESKLPGDESAGLRWTGHPLLDHGIATLTASADRERGDVNRPEDVTVADLEAFARSLERALQAESIRSHASVLFTINVPYLQPSFSADTKAANAQWLFRLHEVGADASTERCPYCGRPSISVRPVGKNVRLYRELVPLLTGQDVVNFSPGGDHGLSLCSHCIVALQALTIGAPSCEGRALVVQADDPSFLVDLVRSWLPDIWRRVSLSVSMGKKVDTWKAPRTRLIERLVDLARQGDDREQTSGLTIFHLSNSGQGPGIRIHTLSARVVRFVRLAQGDAYRRAWEYLQRRAWRDERYRDADDDPPEEKRPYWRNTFYERLFDLPADAPRFVRGRLTRAQTASLQLSQTGDHVPLWGLTELFLKEVMGVEKKRVDAIRGLADVLADEIVSQNDRRLFRGALQVNHYGGIRRLLLRASTLRLNRETPLPPVIDFETFLLIFEEADELPRRDWRLAWDLVLIRLVDALHERGWIRANKDELQAVADAVVADENEPELMAVGD